MNVVVNRKVVGTVCLMIATFLNPLGFDILVYKLMQLTNDYWNTMYILYGLAFVFFLFSHLFFRLKKRVLGNLFVTLALFLNPLGYDVVIYGITLLTKNYWVTMTIMYALAFVFFGFFMYFYKINPIKVIKDKITGLYEKIFKKKSKMKTFDELFEEFFNDKNQNKKKKPKKNGLSDELINLINVLSNSKQITDEDEQFQIDNEYGKPDKIELFQEDDLYFKRSIWDVEDGQIVKLEVSDQPFDIEDPKSLEELLQDALETENYELAAEIRDEMNKNKKN